MTIETDFEVQVNGDVRYIGDGHGGASPGYYTVIQFHRWLQDLADDATATGDDLLDITDTTPSERSTDNIITLLASYNITDVEAEHLYDGSISQDSGNVVYSGLVVVGAVESGTELQIVQNNAVITSYWGTGLNEDAPANILLRLMIKTRTAAADIDGKRIRVQSRELSDTYAEFLVTLGQGNSTAAIFTANDLNNQTAEATIGGVGWDDIINVTEGYVGLDVTGDLVDEFYYSAWTKGAHSINDLYERTKWLTRRGTVETLYGMGSALFRGITHEVNVSGGSGTWVQNETVSWGAGATAGTGKLLAANDLSGASTTKIWIQQITGAAPASGTVTGTGGATGTIGTVTARTVNPSFVGASTGSALIGSYGVGVDPDDLTASDLLFDLTNTPRNPPNNVQFSVNGLIANEDQVLVGPESGGSLQVDQFVTSGALTGGEGTITVGATIPTDTPAVGTIRVLGNDGVYHRVAYTGFTGTQFTGCTGTPAAASGNNVFISYIDKLITVGTSESFTVVFSAPRSLFIRVRDGKSTPIKTFETTGSLGAAGGSTTAIRTSDT